MLIGVQGTSRKYETSQKQEFMLSLLLLEQTKNDFTQRVAEHLLFPVPNL